MGYTQKLGLLAQSVFQDSSLNVGIGAAPSGTYKLEVTGTIRGTGSAFDFYTSSGLGTSSASGLMRVITSGTSVGIAIGQSNSTRYTAIAANDYKIYNDDFFLTTNGAFPLSIGTNNTARLTISSTGNVLIGKTSSTGGVLQVSNGTDMFNVDYDANGPYITAVNNANTVYKRLTIDASEILFDISAAEKMRITSGGQVYMGVASNPAGGRLAIDGAGLVIYSGGQYRQLTQSGNVLEFFNGANSASLSSAGVWTDASDISIKKDIKDIEYGLNEVMKLKPKSYKMIEDDLEQIGFIAQDVEEILPELVSTSHRGMKGLSYGQLTAVLTKAIQELSAQNQDLKSRLDKAGL